MKLFTATAVIFLESSPSNRKKVDIKFGDSNDFFSGVSEKSASSPRFFCGCLCLKLFETKSAMSLAVSK